MIGTLLKREVSREDAEDISHDVIVRALSLGALDKPKSYWSTAAVNGYINRVRRETYAKSRLRDLVHPYGTVDDWMELSEVLDHEAGREALRLSLGPQTGRCRTALHRARRRLDNSN